MKDKPQEDAHRAHHTSDPDAPDAGESGCGAIVFEIKSLLKFELEMKVYPELISPKKWVQKGLNMLKKHAPRVLKYLSREKVIADLNNHPIILEAFRDTKDSTLRRIFKVWVKKEKAKRLVYVVVEAVVLPFTGILALLPGPNFFFYIPALLIYYHFRSYRGLRKVKVDHLDISILHLEVDDD